MPLILHVMICFSCMCYFMIHSYVFNRVLQIIFIHFKHLLCKSHDLLTDVQAFWKRSLEVRLWERDTKPWLEWTGLFIFPICIWWGSCGLFSLMWILPSLSMALTCGLDYYNTLDFGLLLSFGWWRMQQSVCLWVATAGSILYQCSIVKCNGAAL